MRLLDDSRFLRVRIYTCRGRNRGKKRNNKSRTILNENFYTLVIEEFLARGIILFFIDNIEIFKKRDGHTRELFFVSNSKFNFFQIISRYLQISLTYVHSIALCMQIKTDIVLNR